ncbi:MAG: serine aminopeptidase domain-containing protein [Christensenellales bacterium]
MQDEKYIKSFDGELLYGKEYVCEQPKGEIIITTDVKEYSGLYENFAEMLCENGFNVFTYDLRAHKNSAKDPFGTYSGNFFNDCVRDLVYLNKYLSRKYDLPLTNIGIGAGSVILTRAMQFVDMPSTNILVGTNFEQFNITNLTLLCLTRLTLVFFNKNSEIKWLNKAIVKKLGKKFEDGSFESTNKSYIQKIKNDKFCNFNLSANILNSLFKGNIQTFLKKNLCKINENKKFILASGEFDIVTKFASKTHKLTSKLKHLKINAETVIFENKRHNLLNESDEAFLEYVLKILKNEGDNKNDN